MPGLVYAFFVCEGTMDLVSVTYPILYSGEGAEMKRIRSGEIKKEQERRDRWAGQVKTKN
jgi:hypothetical protein